jgi:HAE1 family hydrophobic/amphiphilic exporter-1
MILAVVLILSYGVYSLTTVKQELIPDIELPIAVITVQSPGAQASQVADSSIAPIESATSSIEGLDTTQSTSVAGLGVILYSFEFGKSSDVAQAQLQEALAGVPLAPETQTDILTFDPSAFPVVIFDLQGDLSQSELLRIAQEDVTPALTSVDGVAVVEVIGGAVDEARIALDRQALSDNGVSYEQGAGSLQANNVILPSGQLANGGSTTPIETISLLTNLDTIKAFGVATADGSTVRLDELAEVELVPGTPVGYSRTDGQPPVSIQVTKEKAANTVSVANRVTAALEELEPTLPNGASTSIFEDQAEYITDSINSLIEEGIIGGVLAVVVVFLFLRNWRTTIIIALSIPLSLIAADLGRVVIGGLFTSTLLTLLVIPVVYSLVDGLKVGIARRRTAHVAVETALREKQLVS